MESKTNTPELNSSHNLTSAEANGKTAVVLLNLGTPSAATPEAVGAYLKEFLGDPEVISLPKGMKWATPLLARIIAMARSKKSAANYAMIWTPGGSPLLAIAKSQAEALQEQLGAECQVFIAMRYGQPSLADCLAGIAREGYRSLFILPMYPHFSHTTTGTALREVYRLLPRHCLESHVETVSSWHDYAPYLDAQAQQIDEFAQAHSLSAEDTILLFSAHGLPVSYVEAGDPYQKETLACIERVTQRLQWKPKTILTSFQSRLGPVKWLTPSTEQTLHDLAKHGARQVAVCPISFTADCIETLHEIGIECRHTFESNPGGKLWLIPALNDAPHFIQALKSLVQNFPGGKF